MDVIGEFQGEYRFLSNFFIESDGTHVEGEFQFAKNVNPEDRKPNFSKSPFDAKQYGKAILLRKDWEKVKIPVMKEFVKKKFIEHRDLRKKLLDTGNAQLIEGNRWHDIFWGVCLGSRRCTCKGVGENHLGIILMEVREEVQPRRPLSYDGLEAAKEFARRAAMEEEGIIPADFPLGEMKQCPKCGKIYKPDFLDKDQGTPEQREQHISGVCSQKCWDEMFA